MPLIRSVTETTSIPELRQDRRIKSESTWKFIDFRCITLLFLCLNFRTIFKGEPNITLRINYQTIHKCMP